MNSARERLAAVTDQIRIAKLSQGMRSDDAISAATCFRLSRLYWEKSAILRDHPYSDHASADYFESRSDVELSKGMAMMGGI